MGRQWTDVPAGLILGPKMDSSMTYIYNMVKMCSTWDHHPVHATISEDERQGYFTQQKKRRDGQDGSRMTKRQEMTSKRTVIDQKGEAQKRKPGDDSKTLKTRQRRSLTPHNLTDKKKQRKRRQRPL